MAKSAGGSGNDTYVFNAGDGQDTIRDNGFSGQTDTMRFTDYTSSEATFKRSGNDLTISFINGEIVTLFDALRNSGSRVEVYEFTDQTLSDGDIAAIINSYNGTSGDDVINDTFLDDVLSGQDGNDIINGAIGDDDLFGTDGDDTLLGLQGTDTLDGGEGSDNYIFTFGDGQDTFSDSGSSSDTDTLFIEGYSRGETIIGLRPDGGLDMFFFADNNDFVSIPGGFVGEIGFPSIEFVVWTNDPNDPNDDEVVSIEELLFGGPGGPVGPVGVVFNDDPDVFV